MTDDQIRERLKFVNRAALCRRIGLHPLTITRFMKGSPMLSTNKDKVVEALRWVGQCEL